MFKLYKEAFKATNEGIILAVPLALFWWVITMYIDFSKNVVDTLPEMILSGITMLFMFSGFCAGWFYMIKKCVSFYKKEFIFDNDKNKESFKLLKTMLNGVGKFFLTYVIISIMFLGIALLMAFIIKILCENNIREIFEILYSSGFSGFSGQEIQEFLDSLPTDKILELFNQMIAPVIKIILSITVVPTVFSFLLMLWMPEVIYTLKNPFLCLFTSIKKVFINFGKSLKLYIFISILQILISVIGPFSFTNPILYMLMIILYFYYLVYIVVLIFMYYDNFFRRKTDES